MAALIAGDVQAVDEVSVPDIPRLRRDPNINVTQTAGMRVMYVAMDMDRDAEAEEVLGRVHQVFWNDAQNSIYLDQMQARLAVRQGRYDRALELLRQVDRQTELTAQDQALLAIAARETGRTEESQEAAKRAIRMGVGISELKAPGGLK